MKIEDWTTVTLGHTVVIWTCYFCGHRNLTTPEYVEKHVYCDKCYNKHLLWLDEEPQNEKAQQ